MGWNKFVEKYRNKSILWHNIWKECGRPSDGYIANIRRDTGRDYHSAIRNLKNNSDKIIKEKTANSLQIMTLKVFGK